MQTILIKHTNLFTISFLMCFVVGFCNTSYAQKPVGNKKDNIINTSHTSKKEKEIELNGIDGPYIINDTFLYRINAENKLTVTHRFRSDSIVINTDNIASNSFKLSLNTNYTSPKTTYDLPEKMIVISDIEGNYNAFASFLYSNKVIDDKHNWIYGNGHLVLVGDFVDRGKNVTQVLWLIYKLEQQAKKQNGLVHFILGNHEILNFRGDHRYNRGKYIKAAQLISQKEDKTEATKHLYSKKSELGKWLATKNVVEKIGDYLFVHAGLSPELLDYNLSLEYINKTVRANYYKKQLEDKTSKFLYKSKGPFWYRGLVMNRIRYDKIKMTELDKILSYYKARKIIIGHTPVKTISSDYDGKVIRTDVHHGKQMFSTKTQGLLIENGQEFIIDALATKSELKHKL